MQIIECWSVMLFTARKILYTAVEHSSKKNTSQWFNSNTRFA